MAKKNKILPRMEFWNGVVFTENGDATLGFAFHGTPGAIRTVEEHLRDKLLIGKAFRSLKPGLVLVFQSRYHKCLYSPPQREGPPDEVQAANDQRFKGREYLEPHAYLFITQTAGNLGAVPKLIPTLMGQNLVRGTAKDDLAISQFKEQAEQMVQILAHETGNVYRPLTPGEMMGTRNTMGLTEPYALLSVPGAKSEIQDICAREGLRIGDK